MIAVVVLAFAVALLVSLVTACATAVRGMTAPSRTIVGAPPTGIAAEAVSFPSATGHRLAAWFAPGRPGRGAVLLVHGIRSDRRALVPRMDVLHRAGLAVLALDLRAHGESAGDRITFGHLEANDVAAALAWLRAAVPGERLGALGISLGGAAVALASRSTALDAMVLESVFTDIRSAVANRVRRVAGVAHWALAPVLLAVGTAVTGLRPADLRPIEAVACYHGPVLIISGSDDPHPTIAETRALHGAAPGSKEIWEVAGAGHVDLAAAAGTDYDRRILGFFGRHLACHPSCA